jgi:predicted PurR-regulated permease PerM
MAFGRTLSIEPDRKSEKDPPLNVPEQGKCSTRRHGSTDTLEPAMDVPVSRSAIPGKGPSASTLFLLALAALAVYYCYLITSPFRAPIFLAVMIAIVFHPVHARVQKHIKRKNAAALISTILVVVVVIIPATGLGVVVLKEIRGLYALLSEKSAEQGGWNPYVTHFVDRFLGWAGQYVDVSTLDVRGALLRRLDQISQFLISWGARAVSDIVSFLTATVVALFSLFFLLRDGRSVLARAAEALPLKAGQVERLFTRVGESIVANVHGCLAVGAAQGTLLSVGFWALGVPSPVVWGLVTGLCSLIPIVGSTAVWGPAAILFFVTGHPWKGVILLVWGAVVVAQIDNVVRPYVISGRADMHPLLVFFALLGGVKVFGVLGLFIGPVVVSLTLVVLEMLREENSPHLTV